MKKLTIARGFTLIELLIVVVILGVLAAVAIPQFTASTDDAKVAALDSTLATSRTAIDMYFQEHGAYPAAGPTTSGGADAYTQTAFEAQMTQFTDANGFVSPTKKKVAPYTFGPYMKKGMPKDPISGISTMVVLTNVTGGALGLTADADPGPGGWKYDSQTGEIITNLKAYETR